MARAPSLRAAAAAALWQDVLAGAVPAVHPDNTDDLVDPSALALLESEQGLFAGRVLTAPPLTPFSDRPSAPPAPPPHPLPIAESTCRCHRRLDSLGGRRAGLLRSNRCRLGRLLARSRSREASPALRPAIVAALVARRSALLFFAPLHAGSPSCPCHLVALACCLLKFLSQRIGRLGRAALALARELRMCPALAAAASLPAQTRAERSFKTTGWAPPRCKCPAFLHVRTWPP